MLIDREPVKTFIVQRQPNVHPTLIYKDLKARIPVSAGPHDLAVTFVKEGSSLTETLRQPTVSRFNDLRYARTVPAIVAPVAPADDE